MKIKTNTKKQKGENYFIWQKQTELIQPELIM